jgi:hypothetical protein
MRAARLRYDRYDAGGNQPAMQPTFTIAWAPHYQAEWDEDPARYVAAGVVAWGHSRRLARVDDPARAFKAYLGVRHAEPRVWGSDDAPYTRFFLSLFLHGRTITLRTFATMPEALAALHAFYATLA